MRLQTSCPRFVEYQFLYPDSIRLQRALCSFYATVVRFCAKAVEVIGRTDKHPFFAFVLVLKYFIILLTFVLQDSSNSQKLCGCPFDREFEEVATELLGQNKEVKEEIRLASEQAAHREQQLQVAVRKQDRAWKAQIQLPEVQARKQNMLNRLSTHDYVAPLKRERKKRYGSASHWISATKEYDEWLRDNSSAKFWLSGILGSGKSVLTAAVVDDLLGRQKPKNSFLVFFFCQHDNANSLQARTIVGCLLQ